tara:strand:- start:147 stop:362 length:216 start_codon:yes stop_codon:yes gene_type:complete
MSDTRLEHCPKCKGKVRRLVSGGSGLIFKGSGFYLTDYVKKDSSEKKEESTASKKSKKDQKKEQKKESDKS